MARVSRRSIQCRRPAGAVYDRNTASAEGKHERYVAGAEAEGLRFYFGFLDLAEGRALIAAFQDEFPQSGRTAYRYWRCGPYPGCLS